MQFPKSNQEIPISLEFISSDIGSANVDIPLVEDGDLAILFTAAHGLSIAKVWPADFTEVKEDSDTDDSRMVSGYKLLSASDSNANLVGMNDTTDKMAIMIFRPSKPISSIEVFSVNGEATISDPSAQTIDMSLAPAYQSILAVTFMSGTSTLAPSTSPVMTELSVDSTGSAFYTIFNIPTTPVNITVDMPDEGDNVMQSWALAIT